MSNQTITEPITIAEWWKNRRKEAIRVRLSSYEGHPLIDVRTWHSASDGTLKPGKGFSASIRHLPRLATEIGRALNRARELGLIEREASHE